MLRILVAGAALVIFVKCAGKFGFRKTLQWAALLIASIFPFSLAGGILLPVLHRMWSAWTFNMRGGVIIGALAFSYAAVKRVGWGQFLIYCFGIAAFVCCVFLFLLGIFGIAAAGGNAIWNAPGN